MARDSQTHSVTVDGRSIKLSNLDKVLYPQTRTTKADVLAYYAEVGPIMLPHLIERPATRKRWPDGVGEVGSGPSTSSRSGGRKPTVFFNKDLGAGTPDWVQRRKIAHRDHDNFYPVINDLATLTWLAQLAALEIHVPQWRFDRDGRPRNPDRLVLDLDPGPEVSLADCASIALLARDILRDIGHDPVPVTSGSKGIHLYAPLDGTQSPEEATAVARELALALEADQPDRVISTMKRADRDGKVFIDWSQNNGAKTTVSPYSLRGRERPMVAAPRSWAELGAGDLRQLEYHEVLARLADHGDPLAVMAGDDGAAAPDRLSIYRGMRDSVKTPEPVPATAPAPNPGGRSFVIQEHHARRLHYDFRLERDGVLVSWAVPKAPPTDPAINHLAVQTEDHPLEYKSFEGTIPKGEYGGGEVSIWDFGTYRLHKWRDGKEVIVTLFGRPGGGLGGVRTFALIKTGASGQPEKNWLMHLMKTDPEDIGAAEFPDPIEPMLATLTDVKHFGDETGWAFEMKWDGVRTLASLAGGRVRLLSRRGRDDTAAYADVTAALSKVEVGTATLDGEIVVVDAGGRPNFGLLQHRINVTKPADIQRLTAAYPAQLMVFDILELNGRSLLTEPYERRRQILEGLDLGTAASRVHVPPIFDGDLAAAMEVSGDLRLEGVVAKRVGSTYQPGSRTGSWLKIKVLQEQEVVIGGWRPGNGRRGGGFGSLLMGVPTEAGLRYVGRVGSGFDDRQLEEIQALLEARARTTSPLVDVPREDARDAHWVTPSLIGEVSYSELTGPGRMRHPVWKGLRPDKDPAEITWERPATDPQG